MAKQSSRHFGGNKKAAPVGRGAAKAPTGSGTASVAPIPSSRAVKKGGGGKGKAVPANKSGKSRMPC